MNSSVCVVGTDATMVYDAVHNVIASALGGWAFGGQGHARHDDAGAMVPAHGVDSDHECIGHGGAKTPRTG